MADTAVRYFVPDGSRLPRGLRGKLMARQTEFVGAIASGIASDYADYRYRAGIIAGMKEAIDICEQLEKDEGRNAG